MKKHVNIPIFIPHLGCPNQCVFCNQRTISGVTAFDMSTVRNEIENALGTIDPSSKVEIAFFGGSFTGIDRELMASLLKLANEYILQGRVDSLRCSTRPDYIDEEVLIILKEYGVKTIELGLQSTSDEVLKHTKRGHSRKDEENACKLIVEYGFNLVGQMMIGLPGATLTDEIETARFIVASGATGARIYPTVVFHDTELCEMSKNGEYTPIGLNEAVERSAHVLNIFIENCIEVIRIGLCSSENLTDDEKYYAGPNHPAIGELVESALYYNKIATYLDKNSRYSDINFKISVAKGCLSKVIGQKRSNKDRLLREYGIAGVKFKEDDSLSGYELKIEVERKRECT
jgi:histone acetyltransferase (RNA polymerase elongator complex component)